MNSTMIGHFMTELGRNSLQAATLVLAVLLVQWASGKRLAPHWRCALWLVVVARLLVPISLGSTTSLFNIWSPTLLWMQQVTLASAHPAPVQTPLPLFPETLSTSVLSAAQGPPRPIKPQAVEPPKNTQPVPRQPLLVPATNLPLSGIVMPKQTLPLMVLPKTLTPSKPVPQPSVQEPPQKTADTPSVHHAVSHPENNPTVVPMAPSETHFTKQSGFNIPPWPVTLFWLWLAGAMIMLGHLVISSVRLGQRCSRLRPLSDVTSLAVLKECCQAMDMPPHLMAPGTLVIVESMEVSSPALHGLLHPRLLLPKGFTSKFSPEELKFVFLHELAHLKRRDLWMNWVMALLQAVHWFNPLVWFGFARWRDDRELACDAMVLEATGAEHNQEYGETILRLLENFTPPVRTPALVGILEDKRKLHHRIGMIAAYAPTPRWSWLAMVLIAILTAIGLTDAQSNNPTNNITAAAKDEPICQLTLELRDGSRVVGKSLDDPLKFHSSSLGDFKLPVEGIRSIEFTGNGDDNTARLTATNGDAINVEFSAPALHVQSGFGKSELPVKMIRSVKVSSATQPGQLAADFPPGLVALWSGNGNGNDNVGTNNAIVPAGITYAPAKVGDGFQFDGNAGGLSIPAASELNVGTGPGLTLSCWINPTSIATQQPLIEWRVGTHFWISVRGTGCLYANVADTTGAFHTMSSPNGIIQPGVWQYVALTYNNTTGVGTLYYRGEQVSVQNLGIFTPKTDSPLLIGERKDGDDIRYAGILNQIAIFNRALSPDEILAIYTAQNKEGGDPNTIPPSLPSVKPSVPSTLASNNDIGSQLTLELRDGSRVVGKSLDDPLKFHSSSLGDFKLPVEGIRSIEFTGNGDDNTARLTATNGDAINVQFSAPALHVQSGFGKSELPVKMIRSVKVSSTGTAEQSSGRLINVDFGSGGARGYSQKTGFAAIGQTLDDFWNFYDRDLSPAPNNWRKSGSLQNLKLANGETTAVSMSVSDAAGAWNDDSSDPMYRTYDYPLDGGNDIITFTGLPPGQYEVLAYSPDGNYELAVGGLIQKTIKESPVNSDEKFINQSGVQQNSLRLDSLNAPMIGGEWADSFAGNQISSSEPAKLTAFDKTTGYGPGKSQNWTFSTADRRAMLPRIASSYSEFIVGDTSYGIRTTRDEPVGSVPAWTDGVQYARWQNVTVRAGEPLYLTVRNGKGGCAMLSGIQILSSGPAGQEQTPNADFVPKYDIAGDWCENTGNPSDHSTAHCVGKHVVFDYNNNNYEHHFEGDYVSDHTIVGTQSRRKRSDGTTTQMRLTIGLSSPDSATVQWEALDSNSDLSQGQTGSSIIHKIMAPEPSTEPGHVGTSTTSAAVNSTNDTTLQLTLELRDGSRVIGKSLDDPLKFHSASLGDFKLPVVGIRSFEFTGNGDDNTGQLTATNGDVIDAGLVAPTLHVQTGFGKSELPVKMIRRIKVSTAGTAARLASDFPSGLVALWSGNGNGNDSVGTNNAIVPAGITYAPAKVGDGFQFDGNAGGLSVPASPELNVGTGPGFTLSCWIAPTSITTPEPLIEWSGEGSFIKYGVHLWISVLPGYGVSPGNIYANILDTAGNVHIFSTATGIVQPSLQQQVTLTYDKATGIGKLYCNGSLVTSENLGSFTPKTDLSLVLGNRLVDGGFHYQGILNEVAIFNRALSAEEIHAIYTAQNKGEVAPNTTPPSLPSVKPSAPSPATSTNTTASQLTLELRDGSRVVGKSLDDPLKFHSASLGDFKLPVVGIRSFEFTGNGDDNTGQLTATNGDVIDAALVAPTLHVQTGFGKSELPVKMIRRIKVSTAGTAAGLASDFPSGLVALWSGNGNGNDSVGTNNAIVPAGITYAPAKVGDGFQFDGNAGGLSVPASPELNVGTGPGFTLACWTEPTSATIQDPLMEWGGDGFANGVHLWISAYSGGIGGPGSIYANIVDTDNQSHNFSSPPGIIQAGVLQHVALTYDKESGIAKMYYNGSVVALQNFGSFTPMTDKRVLIGERNERDEVHYQGVLNDIVIFNRALSADEIQKMYTKQSGTESAATPAHIVNPPAIFPRANLLEDPFASIRNTVFRRMADVDTLLKRTYN